jgi:hypothetical protein
MKYGVYTVNGKFKGDITAAKKCKFYACAKQMPHMKIVPEEVSN